MTPILILVSYIAGVSHARPNFDQLKPGDILQLRPEPNNQFDANAVALIHPVVGKLGYIPSVSTMCYHVNKDLGEITAKLEAVESHAKAHQSLAFSLILTLP